MNDLNNEVINSEIGIMGRLKHPNFLKFFGYSDSIHKINEGTIKERIIIFEPCKMDLVDFIVNLILNKSLYNTTAPTKGC